MNSEMGLFEALASDGAYNVCVIVRGELAIGRIFAPQTCIRQVRSDPDHDAVMRIGGKAPGGGPILSVGIGAMFEYGFPPPRIVNSAVCRKASVLGRDALPRPSSCWT